MNLRNLLLVTIPSVLYIGHASLYWHWLIDDAGISIAYAHNLVVGNGLVAQAGAEPVEGFSNPLWTFLLAMFMATGTFSTYWTIKIFSCALAAATFGAMLAFCRITSSDRSRTNTVFLGASIITACTPAFVIWTSSGLENGLLAALVLGLLTICAAWSIRPSRRLAVAAGIVAAAVGLTRPDGLVYAEAFPLIALAVLRRTALASIGLYLAALLFTFAPYEIFRIIYFGDYVPNTFHAKPGVNFIDPTIDLLLGGLLTAGSDVFGTAFPYVGGFFAGILVISPLFLIYLRNPDQRRPLFLLYLFCALARFAYMALPQDWMPHYRFATPLFPLIALFLLALSSFVFDALLKRPSIKIVQVAAAALIALSVSANIARANDFATNPAMPLAQVANTVGLRFNWYREHLGIQNASLLSPDLGGTLIYSDLEVVDLAGLCDRKIGALVHRDSKVLRDYLLVTRRPTFVHIHTGWVFGLSEDQRFLDDYVSLSDTDWVRRDAIVRVGDLHAAGLRTRPPSFDVAKAVSFPPLQHSGVVSNR